MKIKVNGSEKSFNFKQSNPKLDQIVKELQLNPKLIVIEYNGAILNQEMWGAQTVKDGDNLEIVTIVGGGSF